MDDSQKTASDPNKIVLSDTTENFLTSRSVHVKRETPLEGEEFKVSETVSFFGFAYEKMRNAVEFQEEHLICRMAIRRIINRRLAINPTGEGEGQNLAREILWGRYVPANILSQEDIVQFQKIIDSYILFFKNIKETHSIHNATGLNDTILDLMSCELEEALNREQTIKKSAELYFFYQTLVGQVAIEGISDDVKNTYFYVATEKALGKNDKTSIMYHLFLLRYGELHTHSHEEIHTIATHFHEYLTDTSKILNNPFDEKLTKFAQKQTAPFRILYSVLEKNIGSELAILNSDSAVKDAVEAVCNEKYAQTRVRLRNSAMRSITYIFLTKMVFVLIIEIPLTQLIYHELGLLPIVINTLLPPLLMGVIVSIISPPSSTNTSRIYHRIIDIINADTTFEKKTTHFTQDQTSRRPLLLLAFSTAYLIVFMLVFISLYVFLDMLSFNIVSKAIFMFFLTVVTFFAYRIRQTAKEFVMEQENSLIISSLTFLFLPILYVGKILSAQVSKINVFIIFFDYLIEAPFKFLIDIFDEWTRFIKARKDDLV